MAPLGASRACSALEFEPTTAPHRRRRRGWRRGDGSRATKRSCPRRHFVRLADDARLTSEASAGWRSSRWSRSAPAPPAPHRTHRKAKSAAGRRQERGAGSLRFGAKMVTATLEEFITGALYFEHGQTTLAPMMNKDDDGVADPEVSEQEVVDLANYVAFNAPPGGKVVEGPGLQVFKEVGCADCHWGDFKVEGKPAPQLWSDLLLHDLGPKHAELDYEERTPGGHWRTTPLWGLRDNSGPYLTNGSAPTLEAAVARHGGEAAAARAAFQALSGPRQASC